MPESKKGQTLHGVRIAKLALLILMAAQAVLMSRTIYVSAWQTSWDHGAAVATQSTSDTAAARLNG